MKIKGIAKIQEVDPRWQCRKNLSQPSPTYTPNLHLHTEQFIPKKNGGLSIYLLHSEELKKKEKET